MSEATFSTKFNPAQPYYEFEIDNQGPIVYSECCADRMTLEVAKAVHAALGEWINTQEGQ